jgi:predicted DCC family thiol-disulfide oxidoreductase YuxK
MSGSLTIVYDGNCPFCSHYVAMLRLREALGPVHLVNARLRDEAVDRVKAAGIILNQEMALIVEDQIYSGAECMHRLALMTTRSGLFNRLVAIIFSSRPLAKLLYPMLRCGRFVTLKLMGRPILPI